MVCIVDSIDSLHIDFAWSYVISVRPSKFHRKLSERLWYCASLVVQAESGKCSHVRAHDSAVRRSDPTCRDSRTYGEGCIRNHQTRVRKIYSQLQRNKTASVLHCHGILLRRSMAFALSNRHYAEWWFVVFPIMDNIRQCQWNLQHAWWVQAEHSPDTPQLNATTVKVKVLANPSGSVSKQNFNGYHGQLDWVNDKLVISSSLIPRGILAYIYFDHRLLFI